MARKANTLTASQQATLIATLKNRFDKHPHRHKAIKWDDVLVRLEANTPKLWSLNEMEATGGEPDVISFDQKTGSLLFADCAAESPKERRSLCYDDDALEARKEHKPSGSAVGMADAMGVRLMNEDEYRLLQSTGAYDLKTSSWLLTPESIRRLDGAIFGDRRYNQVFIYHNGAQSYYAARGFRTVLSV